MFDAHQLLASMIRHILRFNKLVVIVLVYVAYTDATLDTSVSTTSSAQLQTSLSILHNVISNGTPEREMALTILSKLILVLDDHHNLMD
jgi:hypothetical protein